MTQPFSSTNPPPISGANAGVWLDGARGWHNNYLVVDIAEAFGLLLCTQDRAIVEAYRDNGLASSYEYSTLEAMDEISQAATNYLQDLAPEGYAFVWAAGELSLQLDDQDDD